MDMADSFLLRVEKHLHGTAEPSPEDRLLGLEDLREELPRFIFDGIKAVRKQEIAQYLRNGSVSADLALHAIQKGANLGNGVKVAEISRRLRFVPKHVPENPNDLPAGGETDSKLNGA